MNEGNEERRNGRRTTTQESKKTKGHLRGPEDPGDSLCSFVFVSSSSCPAFSWARVFFVVPRCPFADLSSSASRPPTPMPELFPLHLLRSLDVRCAQALLHLSRKHLVFSRENTVSENFHSAAPSQRRLKRPPSSFPPPPPHR